jgi:steroid delta-isomerase-like uncharacterized protein
LWNKSGGGWWEDGIGHQYSPNEGAIVGALFFYRGGDTMSLEENKTLVSRYTDEANKRNLAAMEEIYDTNYIAHVAGGQGIRGPEGVKEFLTTLFSAYPDLHWTIESMVAKEDKVMLRYTAEGTHKGEIMDISPTGKQIIGSGINIYRIAAGKIVESWNIDNQVSMMQQSGTISQPG